MPINNRVFGSDIPIKVKKTLEARQLAAEKTRLPGDQINPSKYPDDREDYYNYGELLDNQFNGEADLSSRTPFIRMWTGVQTGVYEGTDEIVLYEGQTISKEAPALKGSVNLNLGLMHTTDGYWNGLKEPNSRSTILTIGAGLLKNTNFGVVNISLLKPIFIEGGFSGTDADVESKVYPWRVTISFRRMLDYVIPFLDPFKDL